MRVPDYTRIVCLLLAAWQEIGYCACMAQLPGDTAVDVELMTMRRHVKEFVHPKLTRHTLAVAAAAMAYSKGFDVGVAVFAPEQYCQAVRVGFVNINHKHMHHSMVDGHNSLGMTVNLSGSTTGVL